MWSPGLGAGFTPRAWEIPMFWSSPPVSPRPPGRRTPRAVGWTLVLPLVPAWGCAAGEGLLDRASELASGRVIERIDTEIEEGLGCPFDDQECLDARAAEARAAGAGDAPEDSTHHLRPGEGAWANFDFVPGSRILVADDFSTTPVGDFPANLDFVQGSLQVVEWQGRRLLESTGASRFQVTLQEPLPERFSIEFDLYKGSAAFDETGVVTEPWSSSLGAYPRTYMHLGAAGQGVSVGFRGRDVPAAGVVDDRYARELVTIRVRVDGERARMYQDEVRVANLPNAELTRGERLEFRLRGSDDAPSYLANLRIAADDAPLERQFAEQGRVTLQGIHFDTGQSHLRPESTGTLDLLAGLLRSDPGLRLTIEGHTDAVGNPEANRRLSEARAQAVVRDLVDRHQIDPVRLEAVGFGESRPVDTNESAEGRQKNRRVEIARRAEGG